MIQSQSNMKMLSEIDDMANQLYEEIGKYRLTFTLSPQHLLGVDQVMASLEWQSIKYGWNEIEQIPADKRGLYAFVAQHQNSVLPSHGYVMYIGVAGKKSNRSLRDRYRDYLYPGMIRRRIHIVRMIGTWHPILRFFYAPVGDEISSQDLLTIERQLNTALMPPFSIQDLDGSVREMRRAF